MFTAISSSNRCTQKKTRSWTPDLLTANVMVCRTTFRVVSQGNLHTRRNTQKWNIEKMFDLWKKVSFAFGWCLVAEMTKARGTRTWDWTSNTGGFAFWNAFFFILSHISCTGDLGAFCAMSDHLFCVYQCSRYRGISFPRQLAFVEVLQKTKCFLFFCVKTLCVWFLQHRWKSTVFLKGARSWIVRRTRIESQRLP